MPNDYPTRKTGGVGNKEKMVPEMASIRARFEPTRLELAKKEK